MRVLLTNDDGIEAEGLQALRTALLSVDGIELADQANLPRQVTDFIPQHHGTRLIAYFLHRAKEEAERAGGKVVQDPEKVRARESLRLARTELERQLQATTSDRRRPQLKQAIDEVDRRIAALA